MSMDDGQVVVTNYDLGLVIVIANPTGYVLHILSHGITCYTILYHIIVCFIIFYFIKLYCYSMLCQCIIIQYAALHYTVYCDCYRNNWIVYTRGSKDAYGLIYGFISQGCVDSDDTISDIRESTVI